MRTQKLRKQEIQWDQFVKGPNLHTQHFGVFLTGVGPLRILNRVVMRSNGTSDFTHGSGVT